MRRGRNRCRGTIEQNTPTRSASGEALDSWSTYASLWGELVPVSGGETFRGRQVLAEANSVLTFDWIDAQAVTPRMRVVFGARTFDVLAVRNVEERNRKVELQLRERNA